MQDIVSLKYSSEFRNSIRRHTLRLSQPPMNIASEPFLIKWHHQSRSFGDTGLFLQKWAFGFPLGYHVIEYIPYISINSKKHKFTLSYVGNLVFDVHGILSSRKPQTQIQTLLLCSFEAQKRRPSWNPHQKSIFRFISGLNHRDSISLRYTVFWAQKQGIFNNWSEFTRTASRPFHIIFHASKH